MEEVIRGEFGDYFPNNPFPNGGTFDIKDIPLYWAGIGLVYGLNKITEKRGIEESYKENLKNLRQESFLLRLLKNKSLKQISFQYKNL